MTTKPKWIGVDWGTSNLRVYGVDENGAIIAEDNSERGMNSLEQNEFEEALIELIEPWLSHGKETLVFACGMVGARQGWHEVDYRPVPCHPFSSKNLSEVPTNDPRIKVKILPGLSQLSPADVMRGEETQIAGFIAEEPEYTGAICLPGTHSKWVSLEKGRIVEFQTFMTGELFSLISSQSVLRYSVSENGIDELSFLDAALKAAGDPNFATKHLFGLRASSLLTNQQPSEARARLSGMIIGQEICAANNFWNGVDVVLIGAPVMTYNYQIILEKLDVKTRVFGSKEATMLGLSKVASVVMAA